MASLMCCVCAAGGERSRLLRSSCRRFQRWDIGGEAAPDNQRRGAECGAAKVEVEHWGTALLRRARGESGVGPMGPLDALLVALLFVWRMRGSLKRTNPPLAQARPSVSPSPSRAQAPRHPSSGSAAPPLTTLSS